MCLISTFVNIRASDVWTVNVEASELLFALILVTCAHERLTNITVHVQVGTSCAWSAIISSLSTLVNIDTDAVIVFSVAELTRASVATVIVQTETVWITTAVVVVSALVIVDAWLS